MVDVIPTRHKPQFGSHNVLAGSAADEGGRLQTVVMPLPIGEGTSPVPLRAVRLSRQLRVLRGLLLVGRDAIRLAAHDRNVSVISAHDPI
jgi:hypothetical protein